MVKVSLKVRELPIENRDRLRSESRYFILIIYQRYSSGGGRVLTIIERALELVPNDSRLGLGSGHAAQAFIKALGERIRNGSFRVHGVPTSEETAKLARQEGIPPLPLPAPGSLDLPPPQSAPLPTPPSRPNINP